MHVLVCMCTFAHSSPVLIVDSALAMAISNFQKTLSRDTNIKCVWKPAK